MTRNSVNSLDVGQALVTSTSTRRNRYPNHAKSGNVASSNTAGDNGRGSTNDGDKKHNDVRNKCHRLEPQRRWCECTAHVVPAPKESQDGSGSINGSLLISVESSMSNAVGERNSSDDSIEK